MVACTCERFGFEHCIILGHCTDSCVGAHTVRVYAQGLRKRFFTLKGNTLEYYKDDSCQNLRSTIKLEGDVVVTRVTKTMFKIDYAGKQKTLSLVAEDEDICVSWVEALQARIKLEVTLTSEIATSQVSSCSDSDY